MSTAWVIALRCARIDDDGLLTAYAGAGIVADSDPDSDHDQTNQDGTIIFVPLEVYDSKPMRPQSQIDQ